MRHAIMFTLLVACGGGTPTPTGTACVDPDPGTLTYENFGAQFLNVNCNTCHASTAGHRHGAPESYAFDTIEGVHKHRDRIFVRAATSNVSMPPGPEDPPAEDRERLAEWLACGAP